jgi:alpha-glucosidase
MDLPLSFLGEGNYTAEIYSDAPDAGENPTHTTITTQTVDHQQVLKLHLASGGGSAIWIHPVSPGAKP